MSQPAAQIIRLGLAGNDIGNAGAVELFKAITVSAQSNFLQIVLLPNNLFPFLWKHNATLTYVDLRSNAITDDGILSMIEHVAKNRVLYQICLHGNNRITQEAIIYTERFLYFNGADVRLQWSNTNRLLLPNQR